MHTLDIPVFVVSLKTDTERRDRLKGRMDALGIPIEFVDAFDARTELDSLDSSLVNRDPALNITAPEYGCSLSHAFLYKRIVQEQIPHALILEDDAIPLPELVTFLLNRCYEAAPLMLLFHGRSFVKRRESIPLFEGVVARPLNLNCSHTVAYSVNLAAATELVKATTPVQTLPDWPMDIASLDACIVRPVLVQHPPHSIGSTLEAARLTKKPKPLKRYLKLSHWKRKLVRLQSECIRRQKPIKTDTAGYL